MFFALEMIHLAYVAASAAMGTSMYPVQLYPHLTQLEESVPIQMVRENYRADGNGECVFNGTMVPYVRDWEIVEEVGGMTTVLPANLDRIAGMALVLHTKECGNERTYVSRLGDQNTAFEGALGRNLRNMHPYKVSKPDSLPRWLPQVEDRLARLAIYDVDARDAFSALQRGAKGEKEGTPVVEDPLSRTIPSRSLVLTHIMSSEVRPSTVTWPITLPVSQHRL